MKKRTFSAIVVLALAMSIAAAASATAPPWYVNGNPGHQVCDRSASHAAAGPFATKALCEAYIADHTPAPPPVPNPEITPETFAQINRDGACASSDVLRVGDGSYGRFVDLDSATFDLGTFLGVKFTPALFAQGIGETCVVPAGFKYAGYAVDGSGTVNEAAPQFNLHPFYAKG